MLNLLDRGLIPARVYEGYRAMSASVHVPGASLPSRVLGWPRLRGRVQMMMAQWGLRVRGEVNDFDSVKRTGSQKSMLRGHNTKSSAGSR